MTEAAKYEERLRELEQGCGGHNAQSEERWRNQFHKNKTAEEKMGKLESCVRKLKTAITVNNVKLAGIFIAAQIIISAVMVAAVAKLFAQ